MSKKKILLVDDSTVVVMIEKMLLAQGGYDIISASDGAEGVATAVAEKPDLILMDVVMPRMDGFEACRRIRENPETKDIPIIIVTTKSEIDKIQKASALKCQGYVTKPIDAVELVAMVKALIG